ncbi:MAG: DUF1343 domain-containing protein [Deltaproteobacteria bacterium]|nr:DUF1343 domain-containing protein [Deltaproteobacteria bacterium]
MTTTGLDVLVSEGMQRLRGHKVALLGHPASVDARLTHLLDACRDAGVSLVRLFGPEHGLLGDAQDMAHVGGHNDARTGLPVVSLYGPTRDSLFLKPEHLDGVDVLVCDLQDIGCRYYTFAYTIAFALRACAAAGKRCLVLDRPNPIGAQVEGNVVDERHRSFVGEYPLANRHGMTLGELCRLFAAHDGLAGKVDLEVVWASGWRRGTWHDDTGLPWVLPSPNMPTTETALVYPGACLFEGTNLSEGRGTTRPFELVGAPYIDDPHRFAALAAAQGLPGCVLRPCFFRPTFQKHAGQLCGGVQIHVLDRDRFDSLKTGVAVLIAARAFAGFEWRRTTYEYVSDRLAIDLLFGCAEARALIERGAGADDVMASFAPARARFLEARAPFLHPGYG